MTKKALRFDAGDNVAVALEAMSAGDRVLINGEDAGIEIRAVSYTHLDVYKRQALKRRCASRLVPWS